MRYEAAEGEWIVATLAVWASGARRARSAIASTSRRVTPVLRVIARNGSSPRLSLRPVRATVAASLHTEPCFEVAHASCYPSALAFCLA
jgi:hypothetical protein